MGVVATLLASCGGGNDTDGSPVASSAGTESSVPTSPSAAPDDTSPATSAPAGSAPVVTSDVAAPDALQFTAPLVGGGSLDFTQYAGKTVALWFWAPT